MLLALGVEGDVETVTDCDVMGDEVCMTALAVVEVEAAADGVENEVCVGFWDGVVGRVM